MPKEYIRGEKEAFETTDKTGKQIVGEYSNSNDARISWDRLENGGIVQLAVFRNDGTYEEEHTKPQYMTLDRVAINNMIRILRRARDQAYGRDE